MMRRIAKAAGIVFALLVLVTGGLFLAGMRVQLEGGGSPRLAFPVGAEAQARRIAQHREAQRAQASPAAPRAAPEAAVAPQAAPQKPGAAIAAPKPVGSAYWTDFRGPRRDGHYRERPIATSWPAGGLQPLWKQPVGGGYASFVAARGRAFTIEQRGDREVVAAYDLATGREIWTDTWNAHFRESMGGNGPRATPTWADRRVYALGALGELRALDDATGKVLWRTNILEDASASNLQWGMAAAPLVVDDTLVVLPGGDGGRSVVAYDRATGRRAWSMLDDQQGYASPMLVTLGGVRQILVFTASRLVGIAPDGRQLLWEYPWKTPFDVNASQPLVIGEDRVFISTGYGTGAAVVEVARDGDRLSVREIWRNIRMKNQFTSSVLHEGYVYGLDESILACVDAATGDLKWKGGRYGYGQVVLASGHIIVLSEGGDLALVRATPERHQELVRFPVLDGKTWNHPALSDGVLLIRNITEMAAFDLRAN